MTIAFNSSAGRPRRRSRAEVLLRLLISSSYPHSVLGDLAILFSQHADEYNSTQKFDLESIITGAERQFDMFDFIRSIDITRKNGELSITVKRLDFEPTARDIIDSPSKHEFMASITLKLYPSDKVITDLWSLSETLLGVYYYCQMKPTDERRDIRSTSWTLRERKTETGKIAKLSNKKAPIVDTQITYHRAVDYFFYSLAKKSFRIILTHNTILLLDQQRRLWCTPT